MIGSRLIVVVTYCNDLIVMSSTRSEDSAYTYHNFLLKKEFLTYLLTKPRDGYINNLYYDDIEIGYIQAKKPV